MANSTGTPRQHARRLLLRLRRYLVAGLLMGAVVGGIVWFASLRAPEPLEELPLLWPASHSPYEHRVLAVGDVESTANVEIRCRVRPSSGGSGIAHLNMPRSQSSSSQLATAASGSGSNGGQDNGSGSGGTGSSERDSDDGPSAYRPSEASQAAAAGSTVLKSTGQAIRSRLEALTRARDAAVSDASRGASDNRSEGDGSDSGQARVGSTTILEVVPEGTQVEKGDLLMRLDCSLLSDERIRQRIVVNTAESTMQQSRSDYEMAQIAKEEYLNGTFIQQEQEILNEIILAEERVARAQETARFNERLVQRNYLAPQELRDALAEVKRARLDLELARNKLHVLRTHTRPRMEKQFDAEIATTKIIWENDQKSYQLEVERLKEIGQQIANCDIRAPQAGYVVYANVISRRESRQFTVEEGAVVRDQQVLLRLPDPKQMHAKVNVDESQITLLEPGMPASIRLRTSDHLVLSGEVVKVNDYPEPSRRGRSNIKYYAATVQIHDPPPQIRTGLTAEVQIHVERRDDTLQIPVQAVHKHKGHTFCLVKTEHGWETRQIQIHSTNTKMAAIDEQASQLRAGDQVVLDPRRYQDQFVFPYLPDLQVLTSR